MQTLNNRIKYEVNTQTGKSNHLIFPVIEFSLLNLSTFVRRSIVITITNTIKEGVFA